MQRDVALDTNSNTPSAHDSLLAALYGGVIEPDGFQLFVQQVATEFSLRSLMLVHRHDGNFEVEVLWAHGIAHAWMEKYALQYVAEDMLSQHMRSMPVGRFYAGDLDLPYPEQIVLSRFFREWLDPQGIRHTAACIVQRESQWCTELLVHRGLQHRPFSRQDLQGLDALLPHLARAIGLRRRFTARQLAPNFLGASFDLLASPVFFFDEQCRVSYLNGSAQRFLVANSAISLQEGHLILAEQRAGRTLNFAIGTAIQCSRGDLSPLTNVVRLPRSGRLPVVLMIAPMRMTTPLGCTAGALVIGFDPSVAPALCTATVRKLFDLTDAQAELAVALCSGKTLDKIALQRNVTLHTIKSQLKTLFAKTGTRRQAELVVLLLGSPAGFLLPAAPTP